MPASPSRQDLIYGPIGLILLLIVAFAILSQASKPHSCPDGTNCPVKALRMERAGTLPRGATEGVILELPPELRTRNWCGGSCVHASNVNLLIFQSQFEMAEWWRKTYAGGEYDSRLVARLEKAGLRYAFAHGGQDVDRNGKDDGEEFM